MKRALSPLPCSESLLIVHGIWHVALHLNCFEVAEYMVSSLSKFRFPTCIVLVRLLSFLLIEIMKDYLIEKISVPLLLMKPRLQSELTIVCQRP
jgi:hypothetical protein